MPLPKSPSAGMRTPTASYSLVALFNLNWPECQGLHSCNTRAAAGSHIAVSALQTRVRLPVPTLKVASDLVRHRPHDSLSRIAQDSSKDCSY